MTSMLNYPKGGILRSEGFLWKGSPFPKGCLAVWGLWNKQLMLSAIIVFAGVFVLSSCGDDDKPKPVTVTSLSVTEGFVGTTVTVNGTNFDAEVAKNKVFFGEKEAEVTGGTTTMLTTKVPAGAATGYVYVQVGTGAKIKGPMFTVKSRPVEISVFVSHSEDDVEELMKDSKPALWKAGYMYMNSSDLELGKFDAFRRDNQNTDFGYFYIGVRFRNVNLPKGAKIIKASIVFTAKNDDLIRNPPVNMRIHGEDAGNAAVYKKDELKNLSKRTKTTASVLWNIPLWNQGDKGAAQTTVDLKDIVQEIASRADWAANHAMNFIFTPEGDHVQNNENAGAGRRAISFDGAKTEAQKQKRPVLKIVYEK